MYSEKWIKNMYRIYMYIFIFIYKLLINLFSASIRSRAKDFTASPPGPSDQVEIPRLIGSSSYQVEMRQRFLLTLNTDALRILNESIIQKAKQTNLLSIIFVNMSTQKDHISRVKKSQILQKTSKLKGEYTIF